MEKRFSINNRRCEECPNWPKSMFNCLSGQELRQIYPKKASRHFRRRETIFRHGSRPDGLYCIASGQVKIFQTGIDGRDQIVRLAGPGDILGYRALLAGEDYNATAQALEETEVCFIDRVTLLSWLEEKPLLMKRLMILLCQDLKAAEERLRQFAQKPVRERIAETLVLLGRVFGTPCKTAIRLDVRLTRQEIAELAGTILETAVRQLSLLKRQGWVSFQGKSILLNDPGGLARIARLD